MSQSFPISALDIYDTLSSDTIFTSLIGTYAFKAGQGGPSLSIVTAGADMPSLRNVTGVECIIQDVGSTVQQPYYDKIDMVVTWPLFLVCWEPATGGELQLATERILSRFLGSESVQVVSTPDGLGSLVQNKIFIKSNMPILAA